METWENALKKRSELEIYGNNHALLFALELHQDIDDIVLIANDALTDGSNDKKCDLIYVDRESGKIIVAQGYWSNKSTSIHAPANKASDLNTAATWIFASNIQALPTTLRAAIEQVRLAIKDSVITSIEFSYVHNCIESDNVQKELQQVVHTADSLLKRHFLTADIDVSSTEVGRGTLEAWYRGTLTPILVTDKFHFETRGGFSTDGQNWSAYSTSVPAKWLRDVFQKYGKNLFSANVRDYLGSRRSDKNINNNIKLTAQSRPEMFWVYNNGITALVHDFEYISEDDVGILEISGIAIVNGAQTTGAIGASDSDLSNAYVLARFVKCSDSETIQNIIRFNNSQNKIEASDFRSHDAIQSRLRLEFEMIPQTEYSGGRRGGDEDVIRRNRESISSYSVAQALMAFHGDPGTAYNKRSEIWQSDILYSHIFNNKLTAKHALCAYSLLKAVDHTKAKLRAIPENDRTQQQSNYLEIVGRRGATYLLTAAIASSLETIIGRPITSRFNIQFSENLSAQEAIEYWLPIVDIAIKFSSKLEPAFSGGNITQQEQTLSSSISDFENMIGATKELSIAAFDQFCERISLL